MYHHLLDGVTWWIGYVFFFFLHISKGGWVHLHPRKEIKPKEVLVSLFVGFISLLILFHPIGLDVFVCYWYSGSMAVPSFLLSVSS
jgi:hypothetical protein